jgi:CRISPR system Cascade subunit CasE
MYLSRVVLSLSDKQGLRIAGDRYSAHVFVASAFEDRAGARSLFRVSAGSGSAEILVQSLLEPDWKRARTLLGSDRPWKAQVKLYPKLDLRLGQRLRFLLLANAVKTLRPDGKSARPIRVPLIREQDLLDWLRRQGESGGFVCQSVRVIPQHDRVEMRTGKGRKPIVLCGAQFQGVVGVADQDRFRSAVERGLGHGKGFGFGLLSIAPYQQGG